MDGRGAATDSSSSNRRRLDCFSVICITDYYTEQLLLRFDFSFGEIRLPMEEFFSLILEILVQPRRKLFMKIQICAI